MKQLTRSILRLEMGLDLADVARIEFAFAQEECLPPKKTCVWPGAEVLDLGDNVLGVIWTPEDTLLFEGGRTFYLDTRITLHNSQYQPETKIVQLTMNPTLFEEASL